MSTLAILGVGSWGKNYIRATESIKDISLKYLCAKKKESLDSFSDKYIKVTNYKDLLKFKDINGIIICTPSSTHYKFAKYFLSNGRNLLIEKPLTTNYDHAKELKKIYQKTPASPSEAGRAKSVAMVGHIYLYNKAYLKFKELSKNIGEIQYLDFEGCDFGPFPEDSSALWEWAPHDVSMCLDLLSQIPLSASAWSVGRDMVFARLKFQNTQAFMKFGWLSPIKKRKVIIVGSKSSIVFDDTKDKKVIFYEKTGSNKPHYPEYSQEEPLVSELKEFVNCLKSNKEPKTNLQNSAWVIKVIDALEKSINNNGKIIQLS